jgi:DNA repair protein RadC
MKKSFTLHDLPASERPRERLQRIGAENLSTPEVLALILGRGIAGESVTITANALIKQFGNVKGIHEASLEELTSVRGIGLAKAAQIKAAFELARRLDDASRLERQPLVKTPEDVHRLVGARLRAYKREHFLAVLLNTRSRVINVADISEGSVDSSIADPLEVFKEAIAAKARSVILVHNHPSGDPHPSRDDIELTKRLAAAGKTVGVDVLDHVIIGKPLDGGAAKDGEKRDGYFSLKREGLL